jgi:hypothetical protein
MAAAGPVVAGQLITAANFTEAQREALAWTGDATALAAARASGAYGLASMPQVSALAPVPPPEPVRDVAGLGFIPGDVFTGNDPARLKQYLRGQVADARDAARREAELSRSAGVDIKLAWDPNAGREVTITPDHPDYERIKGAKAIYAGTAADLQKMGHALSDFADLLPPSPPRRRA